MHQLVQGELLSACCVRIQTALAAVTLEPRDSPGAAYVIPAMLDLGFKRMDIHGLYPALIAVETYLV